ncbi:glutamine synthetase family protein [Afifella marina]|uniref:L-glutamine synthetase n=1 Tax=Afifella marina DSM 2698 TaxID=1120955 RepID=A0A1G5M6I5_AFIMA|nr:glutamine synthetase family protein [Afifella marina]MBK1622901.1 glutamine synthetase [Afifella marina DSM 2698]MBK1625896.1 glutamine synthetase [Afifella marina]MBK5917718.1 glutamine synthetase [Afifella marina]RAI23741.1 glutamine synthetase [Afifella marina DSM 2698]SCZ20817.1 L-glutamine synthetase [Afifella marina DSM 2698]
MTESHKVTATPMDPETSLRRGVANSEEARRWCRERAIEDIECIVPDQAGVARGKLMPTGKFFDDKPMTLPAAIFTQTITGDYPDRDEEEYAESITDGDLIFRPDFSTLAVVPWASDPTAHVIHNAYHRDGRPVEVSPRRVLQQVIQLYNDAGIQPVVAPELEFYLVKPNLDPDYPLEPPVGRSGRTERARQAYSISAVNEFEALFDDIYEFSEAQGLEIDTLAHEAGTAQMEINLRHGDPVELADQVFLFKRTIREAALRHQMYATFMAKPIAAEPGSAMHIHHSVVSLETGDNIFSTPDGGASKEFLYYIAGLQTYIPRAMAMMAPFVNSYRRITPHTSAPINMRWGYDNRTVGLRVPLSDPAARRVENRVPSSDANPYLAIAASLACGYLGLFNKLEPDEPAAGTGYDAPFTLPRSILDAVQLLENTPELVEIFGSPFVSIYRGIKETEYETFMGVISPWEREYLLLSV